MNVLMWSHDGSHIVVQHSQRLHDYIAIYRGRRSLQVCQITTVACDYRQSTIFAFLCGRPLSCSVCAGMGANLFVYRADNSQIP